MKKFDDWLKDEWWVGECGENGIWLRNVNQGKISKPISISPVQVLVYILPAISFSHIT